MSALVDVAQVLGALAVPAALVYAASQARSVREQVELQRQHSEDAAASLRASNDLRLMEMLHGIDRLFIDRPELRALVYSGSPLPEVGPDRERALAVAELLADFADTVVSQIEQGQLREAESSAWERAIREYGRSPAIRHVVHEARHIYAHRTCTWILEGVEGAHALSAAQRVDPSASTSPASAGSPTTTA